MTGFEAAMAHALELALKAPRRGANPRVGAVILDDQAQIVAEGWHLGAGTPHAEVVALEALQAKGHFSNETGLLPKGFTAVVTLEPCNHTGRTGPCSQALIAAGISRVVYAASDPGIESAGGGAALRAAGIEVIAGVLGAAAELQEKIWLSATRMARPWVTLKWAASLDGRIAAQDGSSQWISGEESRAHAHRLRAKVDAILVGAGTALLDDPSLTARRSDGSLDKYQPLRVVLAERELPAGLKLFENRGDEDLLSRFGAESLQLKTHDLVGALQQLFDRGVRHLLVEGGSGVLGAFLRAGLFDEILIYQAPMLLGGDRLAIGDIGVASMQQALNLKISEVERLGADVLLRFERLEA